jgi:hypothetical protein
MESLAIANTGLALEFATRSPEVNATPCVLHVITVKIDTQDTKNRVPCANCN